MLSVTKERTPPWDHLDGSPTAPPWRQLLLEQTLRTTAARAPDDEAISFEGRSITWSELDRMADRAANGLLVDGQPGDVVAIKAVNEPETVAMMYGVMRAGMSFVPINAMSSEPEIAFQMAEANATLLLSPEGLSVPDVIARGHEGPPGIVVDEDSPFWFRFTGGTTGTPKCFRHTQRAMFLLVHEMALELGYRADDRILLNAPLAHAAFAFAAAGVITGGTLVIKRSFDPATLWQEVDEEGITRMFLVPTMAVLARRSPGDGNSLRQIIFAASPLPLAVKEEVMARFPRADVAEMFGASEIGMISVLHGWEHRSHPGSIGRPRFGNQVRILDDDGNDVGPHEIGVLYVHGPGMSDGFVGSVAAAPGTVREGWVTAGDMAHRDEQGYLYLADRRSDLIISGGLNVYPAEVENVLLRHPSVTDAVVVGVADPTWGQRVVAFVVGQIDPEALDAHCRAELAGYKIPRDYVPGDAVPRSPVGKALRRVVREQINERLVG